MTVGDIFRLWLDGEISADTHIGAWCSKNLTAHNGRIVQSYAIVSDVDIKSNAICFSPRDYQTDMVQVLLLELEDHVK